MVCVKSGRSFENVCNFFVCLYFERNDSHRLGPTKLSYNPVFLKQEVHNTVVKKRCFRSLDEINLRVFWLFVTLRRSVPM